MISYVLTDMRYLKWLDAVFFGSEIGTVVNQREIKKASSTLELENSFLCVGSRKEIICDTKSSRRDTRSAQLSSKERLPRKPVRYQNLKLLTLVSEVEDNFL